VPTALRSSNCPACASPLPIAAAFCPACGTATPQEIDRDTGELRVPERSGEAPGATRDRLQAALGPSCEVRRLLGRGGFAEVYVAYDRRLKREIAVKTLRGDLVTSTSLLERFHREAEAVAKLRHPHVVPIYTVGEGEGTAFFTMPLIDGGSLAAAIDRGEQFTVSEACRILRESAAALGAAHRAAIVHRDVKPENILLEGPERRAVLTDFGIARMSDGPTSTLTGTGTLVGTPHCMSPEQAVGERTLDHRSDQYSLAVVGFRLLAGRYPFEADSLRTILYRQVTEVPPRLRDLRPDVPLAVSDAIARALAKRPEDRFESMAAFAAALDVGHDLADGLARDLARRAHPLRRRPADDLESRVRLMRESMPRWRSATTLVAVVGLALFALLSPASLSPTAASLAGSRDEAIFTARAFLAGRGLSDNWRSFAEVDARDSVLHFLQRTVGPDSAERRAGADIPLWTWSVILRGPTQDGEWRVWVGPAQRIVGFAHMVPDSASGAPLSATEARAAAEREVQARGWALAALQPLPDSTVARRSRTDRLFTWRARAGAIPWRGADSAHVAVRVGVLGGEVASYEQFLELPDAYQRGMRGSALLDLVAGLSWMLVVALTGYALALAIRRQRIDHVEWGTAIRLLGVASVLLALWLVPAVAREVRVTPGLSSDEGEMVLMSIVFAVLGAVMLVASLFTLVAGESLAAELHPASVRGLREVALGRFLVPELPPAVAAGYAYGVLAAAVGPMVWLATATLGPLPLAREVSAAFTFALPAVWALPMLGLAIVATGPLLFCTALARRLRVPAAVAPLAVGALAVGLLVGGDDMHAGDLLLAGIGTALVVVATWRHGAIAGLVATFVGLALDTPLQMMLAGNAALLPAALVNLALVCSPAALATLAWRASLRRPAAMPAL
jgi:serine/threonine-protein kinase